MASIFDKRDDLIQAVASQNLTKTKKLLEEGRCGMDWVDNDGRTALYHAVMLKNVKLVRLLIKYGANVNAKVCLSTIYQHALRQGDKEITKVLKEHGAK